MAGFFYYGESSGARIIRGNVGITQVTSNSTESVLLEAKTWDEQPGGPVGDVVFRDANANFRATNGYDFYITPIVDEADQTRQRFNAAGAISGSAQAVVAERGNRIALLIEEAVRTGDVELEDATFSSKTLRTTP